MPTVTIRRWTGDSGTPTKTDITSINTRANAYDGHSTADTTYPIRKPSEGTNYSYKVSTRLSVDANAEGATINNIKWYTDGANGLGTGRGVNVKTEESYTQATGTEGTTGAEMTGGADAFEKTSAEPLAVTGSTTSTGDLGHFVSYQVTVGTTASSGAGSTETFTWSYDVA
jgi:hypothetical protein